MQKKLIQITEEFIKAIQSRNPVEELMNFYHEEVQQIEFPNMLTKIKTIRSLDDLKIVAERGRQVLEKEEYEIIKSYCFENVVVIEALWIGTLSTPIGNVPKGGQMKAYFAQFYEFKDNKIISQRNYDCFEHFDKQKS